VKYRYFIFIIFLAFCNFHKIFSNESTKNIQIIHANLISNNDHDQIFVLTGNVHIKYNRYHLFCDKIIYNKKNKKFYGHGNVRLESGKNKILSHNIVGNYTGFQLSGKVLLYQKNIKLTAEIINFNFEKKLFQATQNVVLFFDKIKLTTSILEYNFLLNQIFYKKNSIIHYGDFTISSKEGFFYIKKKKIELKYEIQLINKNYTVYANTLEYLLKQNQINFHNNVIIVQNINFNNFIYAKKALFSFQKKIFLFKDNISIHYNDQIIKGKYLFFDQKKKYGFIRNIFFENSKNILISGYGNFDFHSNSFSLILKNNPTIILKNNSVFIYSNILKINIKKNHTYSIQAFSVNSFFLNDSIQGKCAVFNYESSNNYLQLDGNPIFLFQNQQITGKVIYIYFNNNDSVKSVKIVKNAFYTEKINSKEFNQIAGDMMTGFINKENILEKIMIEGNVNSIIFFELDRDKKIIHKSYCDLLSIYLDKSKKIRKIFCAKNARSELIPIHKETPNKFFYLSQFNWIEKQKNDKMLNVYQKIEKYKKENLLETKTIKTMIKNK
jgi:Organic solvent tolerance protein OstA